MQRNHTIDHLRGVATIAMILIHTSYYFISSDRVALVVWNWSQFAVPMFVFCAGYVFFLKGHIYSLKEYTHYLSKRLQRLLLPYYIFALFFIPIYWFTTNNMSINYVIQSIFLIGGIDINWLVLLMIEFSFLFPIIRLLYNKHTKIFFLYLSFSLLFSFSLIFFNPQVSYKYSMWIPWSLIAIGSMLVLPSIKKFAAKSVFFLSTMLFFCLLFLFSKMHHDISFIQNKYPPNIFLLSYGISCCLGLYWLSERGLFNSFTKPLTFVSRHSYSIYFIHYCFLVFFAYYLKMVHIPWYVFFATILCLTLTTQFLYEGFSQKERNSF